jgi:hypothetical protein
VAGDGGNGPADAGTDGVVYDAGSGGDGGGVYDAASGADGRILDASSGVDTGVIACDASRAPEAGTADDTTGGTSGGGISGGGISGGGGNADAGDGGVDGGDADLGDGGGLDVDAWIALLDQTEAALESMTFNLSDLPDALDDSTIDAATAGFDSCPIVLPDGGPGGTSSDPGIENQGDLTGNRLPPDNGLPDPPRPRPNAMVQIGDRLNANLAVAVRTLQALYADIVSRRQIIQLMRGLIVLNESGGQLTAMQAAALRDLLAQAESALAQAQQQGILASLQYAWAAAQRSLALAAWDAAMSALNAEPPDCDRARALRDVAIGYMRGAFDTFNGALPVMQEAGTLLNDANTAIRGAMSGLPR